MTAKKQKHRQSLYYVWKTANVLDGYVSALEKAVSSHCPASTLAVHAFYGGVLLARQEILESIPESERSAALLQVLNEWKNDAARWLR